MQRTQVICIEKSHSRVAALRNHQGAHGAPRAGINEFQSHMTVITTEYIFQSHES